MATTGADLPELTLALLRTSVALADRCVICDIECEGVAEHDAAGQKWWDIRPLFNEHEHAPQFIDMNAEALAYALGRRLIAVHPVQAHLVRILRQPG